MGQRLCVDPMKLYGLEYRLGETGENSIENSKFSLGFWIFGFAVSNSDKSRMAASSDHTQSWFSWRCVSQREREEMRETGKAKGKRKRDGLRKVGPHNFWYIPLLM